MMVHDVLHWTSDGLDDSCLWAFAVTHKAWLYNHLSNKHFVWQPEMEVFTKTKSDHRELLQTHVWGCPAFFLDAKLQDGHNITKFNRRAQMGQFLGFSEEHSSLIAQAQNLYMDFVSPQFEELFDDLFFTINNTSCLKIL